MVENMPIGLIGDLMRSFSWNMPTHIPLEPLLETEIFQHQLRQQLQLLAQHAQLSLITPSPTVSPPSDTSSPPNVIGCPETTSFSSTSRKSKSSKSSPLASPTRLVASELNRNVSKTYSDCEKKHFLDVAYENNWGTTVAANKFTRIWGKGPTRRMFYWWREQFKKEHDREQKTLEDLRDRKTEITLEFSKFNQNPDPADYAKTCLQQIAAIDADIANLLGKKQKNCCSITGEACVHGDGLQEETSMVRRFTTPFICEFCQMPFQKETTCYIHQKLCKSRFVNVSTTDTPIPKSSKSSPGKSTPTFALPSPPVPLKSPEPQYCHQSIVAPTSDLTELAEQLIARLAACAGGLQPTVISN